MRKEPLLSQCQRGSTRIMMFTQEHSLQSEALCSLKEEGPRRRNQLARLHIG